MLSFYQVTDQEVFPGLVRENLSFAKNCGSGVEGLILALGLGYIEGLILTQNLNTSGYVFLEKHLQSFENDPNFSYLLNLCNLIFEGTANYNEFADSIIQGVCSLSSTIEFTKRVFGINSDVTLDLSSLSSASADLNIQINLYSEKILTKSVQSNKYFYPLVINLYHSAEYMTDNYYLLYRENFAEISAWINTNSEIFKPLPLLNSSQESVTEFLLESIKSVPSISQEDLDFLQDSISDLRPFSILGHPNNSHLAK